MTVQLTDQLRILLAGALIATTSGFVVAMVSQARLNNQIEFVEKQYEKQIRALKTQHSKEINRLRKTGEHLDSIEKKIDFLNSTKGNQ